MENCESTLTWIEYQLESFVEIIKERLSKIVVPKYIVSDFDKSAWFTSIIVLLGKVLPPNRFLFRIVEEEDKFLIQFHDTAQLQQPQTIEVPYRKVFDWGVESWEDAKMLCKEDRCIIYEKWKKEGFSDSQIADHFGITSGSLVDSWANSDSLNDSHVKANVRSAETKVGPIVKRTRLILESAGVKVLHSSSFKEAYCQITGSTLSKCAMITTQIKNLSPDIPKCLDIAIRYTEQIIEKIKKTNALTYTNLETGQFLRYLSMSTGISTRSETVWTDWWVSDTCISHYSLKKCLDFYENVLNNLNNQRKELAA